MNTLNTRLNELIQEKKVSKRALSREIGVSAMSISDWTNGNVQPNAESIFLLAKYFGVSSDFLLGLEDDFGQRLPTPASSTSLTTDEEEHLNKYRRLDKNSRQLINQMLERLLPVSFQDSKKKSL